MKRIVFILLLTLLYLSPMHALPIQTLYGTIKVTEPVIEELLDTQAMQRLKQVQNGGIAHIVKHDYSFSRYEHSVGVWALVHLFGGSIEEQVAALLHDASHTVFSHVGDFLFQATEADAFQEGTAYQDDVHEWYLRQTDVMPILQKYGLQWVITEEAIKQFTRLEQELPDMCADRIDYNLEVAIREEIISRDDVVYILDHLHYNDDRWYFDDVSAARLFAETTIYNTDQIWGTAWNGYLYEHTAQALKRALELGIITHDDIHFSFDAVIWELLKASDDAALKTLIQKIISFEECFAYAIPGKHDYYYRPKCRAVDPLIKTAISYVRLSEVDRAFADRYICCYTASKNGFYLRYCK